MRSDVSVVIPLFNSEENIQLVLQELVIELLKARVNPEIVLVNDGSRDSTDDLVNRIIRGHDVSITYVRLARNFGEHNAVMCGLAYSTREIVVIMDDDGQNPPKEISKMLEEVDKGFDVVYSVYGQKEHSWLRNLASRITSATARYLMGKPKGLYLSSFKALRREAALNVLKYDGPFPHLDAILLKHTDSISSVQCDHRARASGQSNYRFRRLFSLWLSMVTFSSVMPLRLATLMGVTMSMLGSILAVYFIVSWAVGGIWYEAQFPQGWATLVSCITLFSGVQLLMLGIMGEYIGKMYMAASKQPQYVVRNVTRNGGVASRGA